MWIELTVRHGAAAGHKRFYNLDHCLFIHDQNDPPSACLFMHGEPVSETHPLVKETMAEIRQKLNAVTPGNGGLIVFP